jgi:phosphate/sulfate permease
MGESSYFIFVIILVVLAVFDLIIGVSNDAVNFLNSSIGSHVAKRRTILIIAGAGVLFGAIFSGGMMEVARKGIFNPDMFVFSELMVVFMAVMLTDIILLDMFNTFGMPTSTTVSIVFELLGASFAVSIIKILDAGQGLGHIVEYLNHTKAIQIIGGIFLSIIFAFTIGWMIMTISRVVFSFNLNKTLKKYGAFFGGISFTTIIYFILIKGAKGSFLMTEDVVNWVNENTFLLIGINVVIWSLLSFIINNIFKLNILRYVVLGGTFALAMAFAGNDLVNFIGVPIAGLESFNVFVESGKAASELNMGFLASKVKTDPILLIIAGLIMVLTLVFSKKARSVTETEVNLGRQGFGSERFSPNFISRFIVQLGVSAASVYEYLIPNSFQRKVNLKFKEVALYSHIGEDQKPAFDLLRASINLLVASILIAFATSMKLPLSTTYVSFMVAMGASLADKAWDRESAVYRVAGVISVIGGWLFTAIIAFTSAALLAVMIYYGEVYMVLVLTAVAAFLIIRSTKIHKRRMNEKPTLIASILAKDNIKADEVLMDCLAHINETLSTTNDLFKETILGLKNEDKKLIKLARKQAKEQDSKIDQLSKTVFHYVQKLKDEDGEISQFYIYVLRNLTSVKKSIIQISTISYNHLDNMHKPLETAQIDDLMLINRGFETLIQLVELSLPEITDFNSKEVITKKDELYAQSKLMLEKQIKRMKKRQTSRESSLLQISIILESQNLERYVSDIAELYIKKAKK